jgi:1,4-dihydroxy-2-naphthoate octaprenyltransferase
LAYLGIGVLSILAAILYTMGKRAYGYYGLGDLFVLLLFGLVGINGTALLYDQSFDLIQILPGVSYGLICVAVLNVNNIRDIEKDLLNNKITVASKLGKEGARSYQALLLLTSCISLLAHHFLASYTSLAPVGLVILSYIHIRNLSASLLPSEYNRQLRMLSIWSLGIAILFVFQLHL